ncbi:MAG: hypothetical protein ACOX8Q_01390 [Christensenellales bacterium]
MLEQTYQLMAAFMIIAGVLALYAAITGKGPVLKNSYPKAMKEDANKLLRKFCWLIGPVATVTGVLDFMGYSWAYWISIAIILPAIVAYYIIFRKRFKQHLKKK